jgi:hypothetical protein
MVEGVLCSPHGWLLACLRDDRREALPPFEEVAAVHPHFPRCQSLSFYKAASRVFHNFKASQENSRTGE